MSDKQPGALMAEEIREQPRAIRRLLEAEADAVRAIGATWRATPPRFIVIAARGTSDHAALYGKYLFETLNGIPVALAAPSVTGIYGASLRLEGALVIGISQSGEAADVIGVIEHARRAGAETLAITNVGGSPLTRAAARTIELHALPERAVAATKTYTSSMTALLMLSEAMSDQKHRSADRIPEWMEDALRREETIAARTERFRYLEECVVLGRGYNLATANELALKLRETCYIRAQPFASPDFVHGPIAIVDQGYPVVVFANRGAALASVMDVLKKVRARGAETVVIGNAPEALALADVPIPVNEGMDVPEPASPFASILAGQIIACRLSVLKGIDPDQPRGLNKVTVTR